MRWHRGRAGRSRGRPCSSRVPRAPDQQNSQLTSTPSSHTHPDGAESQGSAACPGSSPSRIHPPQQLASAAAENHSARRQHDGSILTGADSDTALACRSGSEFWFSGGQRPVRAGRRLPSEDCPPPPFFEAAAVRLIATAHGRCQLGSLQPVRAVPARTRARPAGTPYVCFLPRLARAGVEPGTGWLDGRRSRVPRRLLGCGHGRPARKSSSWPTNEAEPDDSRFARDPQGPANCRHRGASTGRASIRRMHGPIDTASRAGSAASG